MMILCHLRPETWDTSSNCQTQSKSFKMQKEINVYVREKMVKYLFSNHKV